jgi:hypothetical protein
MGGEVGTGRVADGDRGRGQGSGGAVIAGVIIASRAGPRVV